ncbi:WD40 repeat protein [Kutzneria kofuensis]|uniref:WD40 repeat protein n=1 Tax=Kutzneria kofuensis TaxID=103725 RepID=A0A7W9NLM5_9PSEU|nr:WD40 repeat protein [Kutzneria kofuensis]
MATLAPGGAAVVLVGAVMRWLRYRRGDVTVTVERGTEKVQVSATRVLSSAGLLVSVSNTGAIVLWDVSQPGHPAPIGQPVPGHDGGATAVAVGPDGTVATGGRDNAVRLWRIDSSSRRLVPLGAPLVGHTGEVTSVAFSPDGKMLASGSLDRTVRLWNLGADPVAPAAAPLPHRSGVRTVAFSPDGRILATTSDGVVQLWDSTDPQRLTPRTPPMTQHAGPVTAIAFSPNGKILATGDADTTVRLWGIGTPGPPRPLGEPLIGHRGSVAALSFSPDGAPLASGSADGTVRLWDVRNPVVAAAVGQLPGTSGQVMFRPGNDILAVAGADQSLQLWDVHEPGAPVLAGKVATGHRDGITGLAFDSDGRMLATSSDDKTVRVWDTATPTRVTEIGGPITGHSSAVAAVSFGSGDTTLLSAGQDGNLMVWDLHDPAHAQLFAAMFSSSALTGLTALARSRDGHTVAVGTANATVIGDVDADRVAAWICATAGSPITAKEWGQYFPDLPYQSSCA